MNTLTQRDMFLTDLLDLARKDKNVILISVDMGAPVLDIWRKELPDQFISAGISEQNAINVAAGLSSIGKKVYVYFMACWCCRCLEQIRFSCAIGNNPITLIGCGVGWGYAYSGPAHNPTEDLAYMRSICGIEIYSPAANTAVCELVKYTYKNRKLCYIRLERGHDINLEPIYKSFTLQQSKGVTHIKNHANPNMCIVTSGYLLSMALKLGDNFNCDVYDLYQFKPLPPQLKTYLAHHKLVVVLEEQTINCGCFASAIAEYILETGLECQLMKFGLEEKYLFENATRDELLADHGLNISKITDTITRRLNLTY